jgi:ribosome-associated protein
MDIRKLQRAIVDGLEDVKGQNIVVFNTEHLSPLFERVIIASGTSNRQTKALASSVRDAVKGKGFPVMRTEGEDNGEWIIVDCGAAVVHVMQPAIRDYYHLEEIWGEKPVKMKVDGRPMTLVKASEGEAAEAPRAAKKIAAASTSGRRGTPAKKAAASASGVKSAAKPAARKTAARKAPAKSSASRAGVTRTVGVKSAAAKPPGKAPAKKAAAKKAPARTVARPASKTAAKTAARKAPAKKTRSHA